MAILLLYNANDTLSTQEILEATQIDPKIFGQVRIYSWTINQLVT